MRLTRRQEGGGTHILPKPRVPGSTDLPVDLFVMEEELLKLSKNPPGDLKGATVVVVVVLGGDIEDVILLKNPSLELKSGGGLGATGVTSTAFGVSTIQPSSCLNSTTKASSDSTAISSRVLSLPSTIFAFASPSPALVSSKTFSSTGAVSMLQMRYGLVAFDSGWIALAISLESLVTVSPALMVIHDGFDSVSDDSSLTSLSNRSRRGRSSMDGNLAAPRAITRRGSGWSGVPYLAVVI